MKNTQEANSFENKLIRVLLCNTSDVASGLQVSLKNVVFMQILAYKI
jgi:hypothetical protein